jgi:hypothetical protein
MTDSFSSNTSTTGTTSGYYAKLGVNPKEIFNNSTFSQILGSDVRASDFITITTGDSKYVPYTTTIVGIITDDALTMSFGSNYTRPFENILSKAVGGLDNKGVVGRAFGVGASVSSVMGTPLYNKNAMIPIWQSPKVNNYEFKFTLIATSNPELQLEVPLLLLSRMVLPRYKQAGVVGVSTPGPKLDLSAGANKASKLVTDFSMDDFNTDGLIKPDGPITIQYGGVALFENCIIENVVWTVPNTRTLSEPSDFDTYLNATEGGGNGKIPYYMWSEVTITVIPYYPPQYEGDAGNNLGSVKLFTSDSISKYTDYM